MGGVGRSGTTWVSDVINAHNQYRLMFEPFFPQKVAVCRNFRYRQYLRPNDSNPDLKSAARTILTGRVRNRWIDQYNKCFIAKKRLIKDIRANLMLKWIHVNFPDLRIVVLMRHPCAVATSKLKSGWGTHLDEFLNQPELMTDHLSPFRNTIESAKDDFEKHIILWCVENYVPLRQFAPGEVHYTLYERLCVEPEMEYERLFGFLGRALDKKHLAAVRRPSVMSQKNSAIVKGESLVDSWRKFIDPAQAQKASDLLSLFGLSAIYDARSMPLADPNQIRLP